MTTLECAAVGPLGSAAEPVVGPLVGNALFADRFDWSTAVHSCLSSDHWHSVGSVPAFV